MSDLFNYNEAEDYQLDAMDHLRRTAIELENVINKNTNDKNGRHMALAKTKLEECVMWANKGISR